MCQTGLFFSTFLVFSDSAQDQRLEDCQHYHDHKERSRQDANPPQVVLDRGVVRVEFSYSTWGRLVSTVGSTGLAARLLLVLRWGVLFFFAIFRLPLLQAHLALRVPRVQPRAEHHFTTQWLHPPLFSLAETTMRCLSTM